VIKKSESPPDTKEFNYIVFRRYLSYPKKDSAQEEAWFQRKSGYYARVVKYDNRYYVYRAKKW
jgi:hypothetical protein